MTLRACIYSRYSSDRQSDHSIEDQVELCRRLIKREGWTLMRLYEDRAISGASQQRPGYQQLLADAETHSFDVVVTEALDRLGRKLADVATLYDRLSFRGIRIFTHATGEVTQLHIGMLGTMAQLYLSDLREKTRRGLMGRVLAGRSAGGLAYGYVVTGTGERAIDEAEADVVRRIFREFAASKSPRAIAKQLNVERVPGPDGRPWIDTTIRGQKVRGTGVLNNELYIGRLVWNRVAYTKDPRTGKRVARPNRPDQWETAELPELRIVDQSLWDAVKARQDQIGFTIGRNASGVALNRAHRRRFLLSGLLICGCCGGTYIVMAKDRYGCATRRQKGICTNDHTITRPEIEARVIRGLRDRLLAPDLVAAFTKEWQEESNRKARAEMAERGNTERALADVNRRISAMLKAIEDGMYAPAMKARMAELEAEKVRLQATIAAAAPPSPLRLHGALPEIYRRLIIRLEGALGNPLIRDEAMEALRGMIKKVVLKPRADGGLDGELYGKLAEILRVCEAAQSKSDTDGTKQKRPSGEPEGRLLSVVAGRCSHLYRTEISWP